jgi:hypothetical protein
MKTYFNSIVWNGYQNDFWQNLSNELPDAGQFYIDISRRLNPNRLIKRSSAQWSIPFDQAVWPGYDMPQFQPVTTTFADASDFRAKEIAQRIQMGQKFAVMYSGGIDSTVIMCALIKNLTAEELSHITVCASAASIVNNPLFWQKFIHDRFDVIDSSNHKYDDLVRLGFIPISGDTGDCLFGTTWASHLYYNWRKYVKDSTSMSQANIENKIKSFTDPSVHYSFFKDMLIAYFAIPKKQGFPYVPIDQPNINFGQLFYDKLDLHAKTSPIPINSLHDFFWWYMFDLKYINCAVRGLIYYNDTMDIKTLSTRFVDWYTTDLYQQWAMNNNNHAKIGYTNATYKKTAKDYIFDLDHNPWYYHFKLKIENVGLMFNKQSVNHLPVEQRPNARVGVNENFDVLYIDQPLVQDYLRSSLENYEIDW